MVASNGQLFKEKTQKIPPKPTVLEVIPENIPGELKAIPNWMCWCYELRQNNQGNWKWTKPPLQVNSHYARSDHPGPGPRLRGSGSITSRLSERSPMALSSDPRETSSDRTWKIIRLINSYTEISPSGTGVRVFCYGKLLFGRRKNGNVEMYDESSPKYLTITGHHLPGTPRTLERRQTEVERAHAEYLGCEREPKTPEKRQPLTPTEHPVLYIAGEGVSGLRNRVKAWLAHHEVVTPPRNFVFIPATFNLLDEAEIDEVIQIARDDLGQNPSLVVIDTLARNFGGGNENATQDMNLFITNLDRLKAEFGCTVLVVHHTGKDAAKKERGNTALRGASDTMILLDETDNSDGIAGGAAVFCEKQKDASEFDRYVLLKHTVELEEGQESIVFIPKDKAATEYQFLKPVLKELLHDLYAKHGNQPFSFSQGHDDSGLAKSTYMDRLQTLVRRSLVTKTTDDQYQITDQAIRIVMLV